MDKNWNANVINLTELIHISSGDKNRMLKYLQQFKELIPIRIENLRERLDAGDRKKIRQLLHQMSPQLQFFGIPNIVIPLRRLELEYDTMPMNDLNSLVGTIIIQLNLAIKEVDLILKEQF